MFSVLAIVSLSSIDKIVTFLVMLSILVVLHEFGHFIVARRNGVKVNEFAVGMGPKLAGWRSPRSGTLYSLRALPIGGYCSMEGEDNKTSEAEQQREYREKPIDAGGNFQSKSPWRRLGIIVAGPVANFILAYIILLLGALAFGIPSDRIDRAVVTEVVPNTPAAKAGLQPGDRIVAVNINGSSVGDASKLIDTIHASLGKPMNVTYARSGAQTTIHVVPAPCPQNAKQGCIGFVPEPAFERVGFVKSVEYSGIEYANVADQTVSQLGLLVTHFTKYAGQVSGVVGMGQAAGVIQDFGWGPYFALAATISFALGLFNLLPFPALDGGRAVFIIAELLRGKPVDPEKEALVHIAGFAALMALMVLVAFHDIARIVAGKGVL
ncbi:MAG: site-2 protease family protein [Candidatus Eremiobacteraeota bacterium]|nr:site-2 protease family protein [Candidatus Eremiobacteraeota bacterium]